MLKDIAEKYYSEQDFNCSETIIRAANDYYGLGLHDNDMRLVAAYGAGMQTGSSCGAILSAVAVLSMKFVETRCHESADIRPVTVMLTRRFNEKWGSTLCRDIKPQSFSRETRCLNTITTACDILEGVLAEYVPVEKQA